jgi:hypothetical protein
MELGGNMIDFVFLLRSRRYPLVATFHDVSLQTGEQFFRFEIARDVVTSDKRVSLLSWIAFDTS